ncbi:MAG: hypothetical protein M1812_000818 [Candelaria pacifica]|nr:MAG: hypothetical protein M1812_000818 [Candelaria pacifica]
MSAFRKLFGRKKDKEPERGRGGPSVNSDTLRASAYESVSPGGAPQTGTYPIKGNASSPAIAGRQSSTARSRAPSAARHNARKSEIPPTMRAVPAVTDNRPQSSPVFKNEVAPTLHNPSTHQNFNNGSAPAFQDRPVDQTNNNFQPSVRDSSANQNLNTDTASPLHNDFHRHNNHNFNNEPNNIDYEPATANAGMASHQGDRNVNVAPGTALTTDEGNASGSPLPSNMSPNRNLDRNTATHYSKPEIPPHAPRTSAPRQYNGPHPPMGTATAPRQHNEEIANRNGSSLTAADLNTPEYSYLSAVYGEDIADRNIVDKQRKGSVPSQSMTRSAAPYNDVTDPNANSYLNGREDRVPSQDRDYNRNTMSSKSPIASYSPTPSNTQSFDGVQRKSSIPRKQVGSDISPSASPKQHRMSYRERATPGGWVDDEGSSIGHSSPSHTRSSSIRDKPLPSAPAGPRGIPDGPSHRHHHADGYQPRIVSSSTEKPSLEGIVDLSNTVDTQVVETIAPAVIHEDVTKAVHNVREEVYTREIHTHDIYHRIQPVIDVEVLPPRHFLPVEGGGLVEVTAEEVPGRHGNWVIAETASKIPSDEPAPRKVTRFSAAEFDETWDKKTYTTPEGIPRTEEVWVHPPELETGAWATGQTWRMDFGKPDEPINAIKPDSSYEGPSSTQGSAGRESVNGASANRGSVPRALPKRTSNGSLSNRNAGAGELPQRSSSLKGPLGPMVERQRERDRHYGQRAGGAY